MMQKKNLEEKSSSWKKYVGTATAKMLTPVIKEIALTGLPNFPIFATVEI